MRPLRFCMVTTFYPPYHFGGDAMCVQRLSRALVRRGHHVTVIHDVDAYRVLHDGPEPDLQSAADDGVVVHRLESRTPRLTTLLTQQAGRPVVHGARIARLLEAGRFDVINYHNVSLVGGPGILRYGTGVKLFMAHEHWLVCPTHVLWRHDREPCTGRECLRCVLHHRRPPQAWRWSGLLERELRHVDEFIALSEFSRQKHREFGFPRDMEVLPCFLPDEPPGGARASRPSPHERPYFLFVGRLERIKGLDDVIPLFREFRAADLVVAGEGTHGDELRRNAQGMPGVRFLGRVHPDELGPWYRHALALVVPSVCFETFGINLIEAMKYGTPVLARRIGPFPEIVERSGAGRLFSDAAELVASLTALADDPVLRSSLGRAGVAAQRRYWSEEAVVSQYLALVRRVAERRGLADVVDACAELVA